MHEFNSETRTSEVDWPNSMQAIQSIIIDSPSRRLGGCAPITVHTGMIPGIRLTVALTRSNIQNVDSIDQASPKQKLSTDELLESLDKLHKDVDQALSATRQKAVGRHNAKTHVVPYKPIVGDYVVVARTHGPRHQDVHQLGRTSPHTPAFCRTSLSRLSTCLLTRLLYVHDHAASSRMPTLRLGLQRR